MIYFIAAVYNEENEILDLIKHVAPFVNGYSIVDDGSTDNTFKLLNVDGGTSPLFRIPYVKRWLVKTIEHTGLPETVKNEALKMVPDGSWVVMLDADERFAPGVWEQIREWLKTDEAKKIDYIYFQQLEFIDGQHVRTFQKAKLFKKEAITFSSGIHEDDTFVGEGIYKPEFIVHHRKSSGKQIQREREYLETYKRLLDEGKIDQGRYEWLRGLHHYVR